jgi:hypothetical protein
LFMTIRFIRPSYSCCVWLLVMSGCHPASPQTSNPVAENSPKVDETNETALHSLASSAVLPGDWFEDVTAGSGLDARYHTGRRAGRNAIIETVGGGVGLIDFDVDSRLDIYAVGGGELETTTGAPSGMAGSLFRQLESGHFRNVTAVADLATNTDYSHGILAGDLDHDGFPDLLLTCYGSCRLWRNQGDGTFREIAEEAGLMIPGWHTAAACVDLNNDGNLDLFITDYVDWNPSRDPSSTIEIPTDIPPPQRYDPRPDHLLLSLGDGSFRDASAAAGIRTDGMGMGLVAADLNDDGAADVYVANDVVANHLYWGGASFPLREAAEVAGVAYNDSGSPEGSMGVDAEDVDGDARPDLWVTNFELEDNSLYLNLGDGLFQHSTARMGLGTHGRNQVGFGTGFQDFDADGWPDLYVLNGHVRYHSPRSPFHQSASLLRNEAGRRFVDVSDRAGGWFRLPHAARGGAAGDWNNDGAIDLVISSLDEPLTLLKNRLSKSLGLRVKLVGVKSPRDPIGATLSYQYRERRLVRLVKSGAGYLSQSDMRITLPLETSAERVEITVVWPSRLRERFQPLAAPGDCVLVEGHGVVIE